MTHTTEQPKALPCPFCGGHSTLDSNNGQDFRVFCWDCGAKSKEFDCWQKAEAAWNRRTPAPQARVRLTEEQVRKNKTIRLMNAASGLSIGMLMGLVRAIERAQDEASGITQEKQG